MSFGTLLGALVQLTSALVVGWVAGGVIASRLSSGKDLGPPERGLLAVIGFAMWAIALMVAHIVTRGVVFGSSWMIPAASVVLVAAGRRHLLLPRVARPWRAIALLVVVIALFAVPSIVGGSSIRTGDPPLHLGWTEQLIGGEPVPMGMAPSEFARNSYPWGYHAILATLVRLVPGTDPATAHESLHFLFILALPIVAACLARSLDRRAGWAAAVAVSLIGGFGWIGAGRIYYVASPSEARFGADLVAGSPNAVYELYPPIMPREIGLIFLVAAVLWMLSAATRFDYRSGLLAGACVGLAGLVNLPLFFTGAFWAVATSLIAERGRRFKLFVSIFVPALVLLLLWAGRVAVDYLRYDGFVNVTPKLGVEWPVDSALWSWGLLLPLAAAGLAIAIRSRPPEIRALLAVVAASAVLLLLGVGRAQFDWKLLGNETLLHQGRVWPPMHVVAAAFAGLAITRLRDVLEKRSRVLAGGAIAVIVFVGAGSLVFASRGITQLIANHEKGFIYSRSDVRPGSFVRSAAQLLDPDDVVGVAEDHELGFLLFQFSGVRLVGFDDPSRPENELRIRFADLAARWEEARETGSIRPDYLVIPAGDPTAPPGEVLAEGTYEGREWELIKPRS